jgi:hypothetical protein
MNVDLDLDFGALDGLWMIFGLPLAAMLIFVLLSPLTFLIHRRFFNVTSEKPFDFAAFKGAFTSQDVVAWISFYASDAEWIEYRDTHPPRAPNRMVGQSDIEAFLLRVKGSNVSLSISDEVVGPTRAAFCLTCTLSDGVRRIIEHVIIQYTGNKITRQVDVEAWD